MAKPTDQDGIDAIEALEGVKVLRSGLWGVLHNKKVVYKTDVLKDANDFQRWKKDKTSEEVYKRASILENNKIQHLPCVFDSTSWGASGNDWGLEKRYTTK